MVSHTLLHNPFAYAEVDGAVVIKEPKAGPMGIRDGKLLYHLTAIDNLPGIVQHGLLSRRSCQQQQIGFADVADPEILRNRGAFDLDSMVPFHFFSKNPFDYAVARRNPSRPLMLLTVRRQYARTAGWLIVPAHPLAGGGQPELLPWDAGVARIDWNLIERRDYDDNACKQACMAEALSPVPVPLSVCSAIFVASEADAAAVREMSSGRLPHLIVNEKMFPQ